MKSAVKEETVIKIIFPSRDKPGLAINTFLEGTRRYWNTSIYIGHSPKTKRSTVHGNPHSKATVIISSKVNSVNNLDLRFKTGV